MRNMQGVYLHTVHKKLLCKGTASFLSEENESLSMYFAGTVDKLRSLNPCIIPPFSHNFKNKSIVRGTGVREAVRRKWTVGIFCQNGDIWLQQEGRNFYI